MVSDLKETYYKTRFLGARRILPDFLPDIADSTALAALDSLAGRIVPQPDTLSLSPADRRIILFADGTWALVDSTGAVSAPVSKARLLLAENGSWRTVTTSTVLIPDLKKPETDSKKSSASTQAAPPPPADGSAVYHTIVTGDTLYGLARRYGTTVSRICGLNGITTKTTLRPGKKLRIR
ncbi:MAG: LysM peptidoglycan-binding domain-containing protein [Bacteroidales bacterium]|nr:LysM peptidoglycan-binding domain-containing protein [Bacteroidales bacterium]